MMVCCPRPKREWVFMPANEFKSVFVSSSGIARVSKGFYARFLLRKTIESGKFIFTDHGLCVSGAHNTIVTSRAGKDLVSSLVSGSREVIIGIREWSCYNCLLAHISRQPSTWKYVVEVKAYTLSKANNLVMNVDGAIGTLFLDLLAGSGMFTKQEIDKIVAIGYLNGHFVLARSIGLIGHTFDQKRLKQLRHPWEDVLYTK